MVSLSITSLSCLAPAWISSHISSQECLSNCLLLLELHAVYYVLQCITNTHMTTSIITCYWNLKLFKFFFWKALHVPQLSAEYFLWRCYAAVSIPKSPEQWLVLLLMEMRSVILILKVGACTIYCLTLLMTCRLFSVSVS